MTIYNYIYGMGKGMIDITRRWRGWMFIFNLRIKMINWRDVQDGKIIKEERRKFAYTELWTNSAGFTLIELLITLTIVTMTLPLLSVFFLHFTASPKMKEDVSVQQFFIFLRNDAMTASRVYSENNKMFFVLANEEVAKIEQYQQVIRRQVDGKGHEIYLRDITSFSVQDVSFGSKVSVTTTQGETYEKTIAHYYE